MHADRIKEQFMSSHTKIVATGVALLTVASLTVALVPASAAVAKSYSLTSVKTHKSAGNCWSAISGKVYNLSKWIPKHPGGASVIKSMCGKDATAAFKSRHGMSGRAAKSLASYKIGTLSKAKPTPSSTATPTPTPTPTPTSTSTTLTAALVATYSAPADCWSIVNGNVYNLTAWISRHKGGPGVITAMCGIDASAAYNGMHGSANKPATSLSIYMVGAVGSTLP
jgi:cytochrome b involved in lipid metabolism